MRTGFASGSWNSAAVLCFLAAGSVIAATASTSFDSATASFRAEQQRGPEATAHVQRGHVPKGAVRVVGRSFADKGGPFLGLGASYFTALWRAKFDPPRLEHDLDVLARNGFNYIRILSMVGYYPAWEGLEIAPVAFTNRAGKAVAAWSGYWEALVGLIDVAFEKHGLRTQITIFADAQLMPEKEVRIEHLRKMLARVVAGREQKILLLEVANEAWQNGFPGETGTAELREFARFLNERTAVPVAITSNHDLPGAFEQLYSGGVADLATWHFSRDKGPDDGWAPVYDCWAYGARPGFPPVVSNEPIGPGSSVTSETDRVKLVMAAAFAYTAGLPGYVFHSSAGVFGKTRFEETPAIGDYQNLLRLLPADLSASQRFDGKDDSAPFIVFAGGQGNRYWPELDTPGDGCVRLIGARQAERFACVAIGIRPGGLTLEGRMTVEIKVHDPLTGELMRTLNLQPGERSVLPAASGGLLILGREL